MYLLKLSLNVLTLNTCVFTDEEGIGGDQDSDNPLMMLFNGIYHHTDPTGRSLSEPFLRLPSKRFDYLLLVCLCNDMIIPKNVIILF